MLAVAISLLSSVIASLITWRIVIAYSRRSEETARNENLERCLAASGTGTFVSYPGKGVMHCSHATLALLGLPPEYGAVSIDYWKTLLHPDDRDQAIVSIVEAIRLGKHYTLEYRLRLGPDRTLWLRTHGQPARTSDGESVVYGALLDITNIKHLELEILARDARLRDISRAARFYMWELDLEHMEYALDRPTSAAGKLGSATNETYRQSVAVSRSIHHPDDRHIFDEMLGRILRQDVPYEIEARVMHPDGTYHWMLAQGKLVRDGGPRRVRGIIQDIDARKQAALRLQAVEARLERSMRGTNDGMWEISCATRNLWVSPRFAEMVGYTQSELTGSQSLLFEITHPEDQAKLGPLLGTHLNNGAQFELEVRQRHKSGEYRVMCLRGMCECDVQGKPLTVSGSLQDITERRQYQQALIEATRSAAEANSAKSEFLANMSHEIRTPMNGVIGMLDLLHAQALPAEAHSMLETARNSADALLALINDILDFSKIEAGKLTLEHIDVELRSLAEEVATLFTQQANAKGVELSCAVHNEVPQFVSGDPTRLRQIMVNLVGNAVKFTERGEVLLGIRLRPGSGVDAIASVGQTVTMQILVEDTGIGMTPEVQDNLFLAFTQADNSTTRKYGGSGLGLAITEKLILGMGGSIKVKSELGRGSTFSVYVPLEVATSALAPRRDLRGVNALIVDDNPTNRCILEHYLQHEEGHFESASSAQIGLQLARAAAEQGAPFDVVLLDYQMPEIDGMGFLRELRSDPLICKTKCIVLSSLGERVEEASDLGVSAWLTKPVRKAQLHSALARVTGRHDGVPNEPRPEPLSVSYAGARVLVVEDNAVNRQVASRMLKTFGVEAQMAETGEQAVAAIQAAEFDLVLMDCQMPVMDGYEATRAVRIWEAASADCPPRRRVTIVAMTANALAGDREKCLAAGMDDYLAKPVKRDILALTLAQWLTSLVLDSPREAALDPGTDSAPETPARHEVQALGPAMPTEPALNAVALSQLGELMGDELPDVIDTYMRDTSAQIAAMEAALEQGDLVVLGRCAHSLKSSSDAVGAVLIQTISHSLEAHARANGRIDDARPLVADVRKAFEIATPELRAIAAGESAKSNTASIILTGHERMPVLLAEDDQVTRMRMTRLLHNAGYEVDSAANGSEALDKMTKRYYPMLVTDWEMPQMDGIALCKTVRNLRLDGYVYILLLTGRDAKDHVIIGLEAGADDYLVKPVHEAELIARLNAGRRILALEQSLRAAKERNRILSITDALTGAFNRRYLMEQLPREFERCRRYAFPLSVLMCDLDHFKQINDQRGHAAGDDVLQQFAARALKYIRTNSDWMARSGGEEFLIVLPETGYEQAVMVAEKIRRLIVASPFATCAGDAAVTASFGVASTGPNGPDLTLNVETLIRVADESLYKSKVAGRNRSTGKEIHAASALAAHG